MAEAVHRIGRMSISCEAPRGAPARQAAADRLARRLRRDITLALARVLDNATRHIVIDRLDCPALHLFEATDSASARESECRRVGKELDSTCTYRGFSSHYT